MNRSGTFVIATTRPTCEAAVLERAAALAACHRAELVLACSLPASVAIDTMSPRYLAPRLVADEAVVDAARRWLVRWSGAVLGDRRAPEVRVSVGHLRNELERLGRERSLGMVLLAAADGWSGRQVTALVQHLGAPVLVLGGPAEAGGVVAATDLEDAHLPVARGGIALAERLAARVTFVHNRDRVTAPRRGRLLARIAKGRVPHRRATTAHRDTARAILDAARDARADVIVVGARPRSWLSRLLRRSVPARVLDSADRSVLVLPIAPASAPAGTMPT